MCFTSDFLLENWGKGDLEKLGIVFTMTQSEQKNELMKITKLGRGGKLLFTKSTDEDVFKTAHDTRKTMFCMATLWEVSFAFIRYLWLLFYGTVKAYHTLEVVLNSRKNDCSTRLCPEHHTHGSCTKCSPVSRLQFLRNWTKAWPECRNGSKEKPVSL